MITIANTCAAHLLPILLQRSEGSELFCGKGATDDQCIHTNLPGRSGKIRFLLVASTCNWYQAEVPSRTFLVHYRHVKDHWSTALELALSGTIQLPVRWQQSCTLLRNRNSRTHRSNDFRKRSRHINMYQLQSWLVQGNLIDEMQSSILKWLIHCDNDQCETSVHRLNTHSVQAQQCITSGPVGRRAAAGRNFGRLRPVCSGVRSVWHVDVVPGTLYEYEQSSSPVG
jgi:hypothetical protein